MDYKTKLIDEILLDMQGMLASEALSELRVSLAFRLYQYQIQPLEKSDELPATINENNFNALKRFLLAKTIEGKSENTIKSYKYRIQQFLGHLEKPIYQVNSEDIRFYLTYVKGTTNCSNTTLENVRLKLSSFFTWCHDEEIISQNPMKRVAKIKKDTYKEKPFSQQELELLTLACENTRDRALIEFLLSTGCRVSEVVRVNRDQIDYYNKQLQVIGKGNKEGTVYLTEKALVYLKIYLAERKDNNPALFVSLNRPYKRLSIDGIEVALAKIGQAAQVADVHPHRFRRTLCNILVKRGMDLQEVQKILRHENIETTLIYYNDPENGKTQYNFQSLA